MVRNRSSLIFLNSAVIDKYSLILPAQPTRNLYRTPMIKRKKIWLRFRIKLMESFFQIIGCILSILLKLLIRCVFFLNKYILSTSILVLFWNFSIALLINFFFNYVLLLKYKYIKLIQNNNGRFASLNYRKFTQKLLKLLHNWIWVSALYPLARTSKFLMWTKLIKLITVHSWAVQYNVNVLYLTHTQRISTLTIEKRYLCSTSQFVEFYKMFIFLILKSWILLYTRIDMKTNKCVEL